LIFDTYNQYQKVKLVIYFLGGGRGGGEVTTTLPFGVTKPELPFDPTKLPFGVT
jgi:hypothetical protein